MHFDLQSKLNEISGLVLSSERTAPGIYSLAPNSTVTHTPPEAVEARSKDRVPATQVMCLLQARAMAMFCVNNPAGLCGICGWICGEDSELSLIVRTDATLTLETIHFVSVITMTVGDRRLLRISEHWRNPLAAHMSEVELRCLLLHGAVRVPLTCFGVSFEDNKLFQLRSDWFGTLEQLYAQMREQTYEEGESDDIPLLRGIIQVDGLRATVLDRSGVTEVLHFPEYHAEFSRMYLINRAELYKRLGLISHAMSLDTAKGSLHRFRNGNASLIATSVRPEATLQEDTATMFRAKTPPPWLLFYDKHGGCYEIRMAGQLSICSLWFDDTDREVIYSARRDQRSNTGETHTAIAGDRQISVRTTGPHPGYPVRGTSTLPVEVLASADELHNDVAHHPEVALFARRFRAWIPSLPLTTIKVVGLSSGQFALLAVVHVASNTKQPNMELAVATDWAKKYLESDKAQFETIVVWWGNDVAAVARRTTTAGTIEVAQPPAWSRQTLASHLSAVRCAVFGTWGLPPYDELIFPRLFTVTPEGVQSVKMTCGGEKMALPTPVFKVEASGAIRLLSLAISAKELHELEGTNELDGEDNELPLARALSHYIAQQALRLCSSQEDGESSHGFWRIFYSDLLWLSVPYDSFMVVGVAVFTSQQIPEASLLFDTVRGLSAMEGRSADWIVVAPDGSVSVLNSIDGRHKTAAEVFGLRWEERNVLTLGWQLPPRRGPVTENKAMPREDQRDREIRLLRETKIRLQLGVTALVRELQSIEELSLSLDQRTFSGNIPAVVLTELCKLAGVDTAPLIKRLATITQGEVGSCHGHSSVPATEPVRTESEITQQLVADYDAEEMPQRTTKEEPKSGDAPDFLQRVTAQKAGKILLRSAETGRTSSSKPNCVEVDRPVTLDEIFNFGPAKPEREVKVNEKRLELRQFLQSLLQD